MINLVGKRFGRWEVLARAGHSPCGQPRWLCRCDCGVERDVQGSNLTAGKSNSCGCLHRELISERFTTHGHTKGHETSPEFTSWWSMIDRCTRKTSQRWETHGALGITVCKRWRESFESFLSDVGPRPSEQHHLSRKDVNGDFEPRNVEWSAKRIGRPRGHSEFCSHGHRKAGDNLVIRPNGNHECRICISERKRQKYASDPELRVKQKAYNASRGPEYVAWANAIQRCVNQNRRDWKDWGGRGIRVCDEWMGPGGFERFLKHIGPKPPEMTLDRISNSKGYEPGNVRWASRRTQRMNQRRMEAVA